MPWVPPFIWKTETVRSTLKTLEYSLAALLMMVILTGNVAYFVSIIGGVFCGEMVFGRLRGSIHRYL
ncbi:hypothetical protein BJV82DRAFT_593433 [Fennellomyces sp. T-0311]|nr:hypothetical protein BJV82DRAFT_593433 [Fennellomyces sp. T-0311]